MEYRISKIAAECSISLGTIKAFLNSREIFIDLKLNTKVKENIYKLIVAEFIESKNLKEKSNLIKISNEIQFSDEITEIPESKPERYIEDNTDYESAIINSIRNGDGDMYGY